MFSIAQRIQFTPRQVQRGFLFCVLGGLLLIMGNVPAPYWACEGKQEGEACTYGYSCYANGVCRLQPNCTDDTSTSVNECLICQTGRPD
jgi:hypothetical protein